MSEKDIQATAVSYAGHAVLIQGNSGVGKTTLALQLIEKGASLIGDDLVEVFIQKDRLYCRAKKNLKGVIEIRGLGLVRGLKTAEPVPVLCAVCLHTTMTERLPENRTISLLGKKIPVFDFYACETNDIRVLYAIRVLKGQLSLLKE